MFFPVFIGKNCTFGTVLVTTITSSPGVFVLDNFLYIVSTGANTLTIYDISAPTSPVLKSTTSVGASKGPNFIRVVGNYAYITYNTTGFLAIWNITDKTAPTLSGSVNVGGGLYRFNVLGNYAYLPQYSYSLSTNMKKVDISNPAAPSIVGTWLYSGSNGSRTMDCTIDPTGTYIYVPGNYNSASGHNFLAVVSASTMTTVGAVTWSVAFGDVEAGGICLGVPGYVYVMRGLALKLQVFNVSVPSSPTAGNTVAFAGTVSSEGPVAYSAKDNLVYLGTYSGSTLQITKYSVLTPGSPTNVGTISSNAEGVSDIAVAADECNTLAFGTWSGVAKVYLRGNPT